MNLMNLHHDMFQYKQDFHDQYIGELGVNFGKCKEHVRAVMKDEGVTEPSQYQITNMLDKLEEEHHAIMFV